MNTVTLDGKRFYIDPVDSTKVYPSVTTVASVFNNEWVAEWTKNVGVKKANEIKTEAAKHGTSLHNLMERYFRGETIQDDNYDSVARSKYLLDDIRIIKYIETPVLSRKLGIAGKIDLIGNYKSIFSIIDFKTTRKIKKDPKDFASYIFQIKTYAQCIQETFDLTVQQGCIIFIPKYNDPYEVIIPIDLDKDYVMIEKIINRWWKQTPQIEEHR
jgi:ATP-dependent helicase/DNAse subunit B